jgi:IclR family KDG regulon transcriptional repressor
VRDHGGRVVASLSVAGPQSRLTAIWKVRMLIEAAGEISAKLGWHAPVETPELV